MSRAATHGDLAIGIVGVRNWGSKHLRVFSSMKGVSVTAIDTAEDRAKEAAWPYAARWSTSLESVVDDLDAVVIASPPASHYRLAKLALDADCDVLVEKPLTTTISEGQALVSAAEKRESILMCGHTFLSNDAVINLRSVVRSGDFGAIRHMDAARLNLGLYQNDVNVIWDLAPHDISIFNYLLGESPVEVGAWGSSPKGEMAEAAYLRLHYPSGVVGTVHVSWLDPSRVRRMSIVGDDKMAIYDDSADRRLEVLDRSAVGGDAGYIYRDGDIVRPAMSFREPLAVQADEFIDCIRTRRTPVVDGRSGLEVVKVLCASDLALATNRMVNIATDVGDGPDNSPAELIDLSDANGAMR